MQIITYASILPNPSSCTCYVVTLRSHVMFCLLFFSAILCDLEHYKLNSMVLPVHSGFALYYHHTADADLAHWLVLFSSWL